MLVVDVRRAYAPIKREQKSKKAGQRIVGVWVLLSDGRLRALKKEHWDKVQKRQDIPPEWVHL